MAEGVFTSSKGWQPELPSVCKSLGLGSLSGSALIVYQVGEPLWLGETRDLSGRNQDTVIRGKFDPNSDGDLYLGFRVSLRCDTYTENEDNQVDYDYQSIVMRLRPDHPLHHNQVTEAEKSGILAVCPNEVFARRFIANDISCIKFSVPEGGLFVEFGGEPWHISEPYVRKAFGCLASINSAQRVMFFFPSGSIPKKRLDRLPKNLFTPPQQPRESFGRPLSSHNGRIVDLTKPPTPQTSYTTHTKTMANNPAEELDNSVEAQATRFLDELVLTLPANALRHLDESTASSTTTRPIDLAVLPCLEHRVTRLRVNTSRRNLNQVAQGIQHPTPLSVPPAANFTSTNPLQHATPTSVPTARNTTSTAPTSAISTPNTAPIPRPAQITLPVPISIPPYAPSFRFVHLPRYRAIQRTFSSRYSTEQPSPEAAWLLRQLEDAYGNEEEVAFQKAHDELLGILDRSRDEE